MMNLWHDNSLISHMPIIPIFFLLKPWHTANNPKAGGGESTCTAHSTKSQICFQIFCNKEKQDVFF